jgi:general secretion pathway protein A
MYLEFFGVEKHPFSITPDPSFLYLTSRHREALAGLLFAISCRKGFMVLTGDAGTGKTTLLRTMLKRVAPGRTVFSFVVHPTLSPSEFLEYTLLDFGLTDIPESKAQRLVLFHQFLLRCHSEGKNPVLVVDEAQKLSPELLEEIRLLTNAETAEQKLLQIILAGQNELSELLERDSMRQLRQRIAVRSNIGSLSLTEVQQYMQTRWLRAGAKGDLPFTPDAIEAVAHHSRGIPRVINVLCDTALVNAFAKETRNIDAARVKAAAIDLQLPKNGAVVPAAGIALATAAASVPIRPSETIQTAAPEPVVNPLQSLDRYMPPAARHPRFARWATRLGFGGA